MECGNAGALRPNLVPGQSPTIVGGPAPVVQYRGLCPALGHTGFCNYFGNAPRNSIEGPGKVQNNMALSKTVHLGETRTMEIRAQINNVFNTVQYSGVNTTYGAPQFGQVTSVGQMRSFQFMASFRF